MSLQDSQGGAGLQAPDPDGLVAGAGGDHGVLVADRHVGDLCGVAAQRGQQTPVIRPPDFDQAVVRALGEKKKESARSEG